MGFANNDLYSLLFRLQRMHKMEEGNELFHQYSTELFKSGCYHLALYNLSTSSVLAVSAIKIDQSIQAKVKDNEV